MRTTITLDDRIFRAAKQQAASAGITLAEFINNAVADALRPAGVRRPEAYVMPTYGDATHPVHHEPADFARAEEMIEHAAVRDD